MIKEIGFMKTLGSHSNLLVMVGYVKSIDNPVILTELCTNGSLLDILLKHPLHFMSEDKCAQVDICLLLKDILRILLEVCSGLIYMTQRGYVHRDLACRNVLLTYDLMAKLSDFGLCRQVDENGLCVEREGKFPVKYLPIEALKNGQFSEKSELWSFGVLAWEALSGGQKPFNQVPTEEFISFLELNGKPEFPEETPQQLIDIFDDQCFKRDANERGSFVDLEYELSHFYSIVSSFSV